MNPIKDIKESFAIWLQKTMPGSYRQFLGSSVSQTLKRLNEIDEFFPERSIFKIENNNINGLIDFIKDKTHRNERSNNPEFVKYDTFHSNGIPKAIIGKNHYFKFLEELNRPSHKNEYDYVLNNLIVSYKNKIRITKLRDEKFKWQFISDFKGRPNTNALNFEEEVKGIRWNNLIYQMSSAVLNHIAKERSEELRSLFKMLFDNTIALNQRIELWEQDIQKLYRKVNTEHNHHQDERAISVYLTLQYPDQYTFFKDSYYQKLCKLLDLKPASKGRKYKHYMDLINVFIAEHISKDETLISLFKEMIPEYYDGSNNLLVAQDILYQMLDQENEINYWIFQGNPEIYNTTEALRANHLKHWKVGAHKENIKPGDKVIIWQTGNNSGCYALAEVASEVQVFEEDLLESQYYIKSHSSDNSTRVKLTINTNLAETPILRSQIKDLPEFANFNAGNQGTNFRATEEEYNMLLEIAEAKKHPKLEAEKELLEIIQFHNRQDVLRFFDYLDEIIEHFNITSDDERVVTGISNKNLNLTIGQRYCYNLFPPFRSKGKFGIISTHRLNDTSDPFKGNGEQPFYTHFNDFKDIIVNKNTTFLAIEKELNRSTKSSYSEYNNPFYRKAIFDKEYRELILGAATSVLNEASKLYKIMPHIPTNQILYGPPGTGKTYELKEHYFPKYTLKQASITREAFFEETVRELTWWQVIALALLEMGVSKVGDILNNRWVSEKARISESKNIRATLWGSLQMHTVDESTTVAYKQRQVPLIFDKNADKSWRLLENELKEQFPELYDILESVNNFNSNPQKEIKHYVFTTFHQSFAYEDFIEGIKPKLYSESENNDLSYQIQNGVFKELCLRAQSDPENRYAIFIDEINRGNVSAIFGELITLIEADKRIGAKNEIKVRLPYSKTDFGVPNNVDIYGTMNTADRSVEALDTALRRRFSFKEIMPDPSLLTEIEFDGFNLEEVLTTINERIEFLLDRDHTIGHSYFMNLKSNDIQGLGDVFRNKVIPLLQEYFYHDYEKIALILGPGFVKVSTNHAVKFPKFEGITDPDNVTLCELIADLDDIELAVLNLLNRNAD